MIGSYIIGTSTHSTTTAAKRARTAATRQNIGAARAWRHTPPDWLIANRSYSAIVIPWGLLRCAASVAAR